MSVVDDREPHLPNTRDRRRLGGLEGLGGRVIRGNAEVHLRVVPVLLHLELDRMSLVARLPLPVRRLLLEVPRPDLDRGLIVEADVVVVVGVPADAELREAQGRALSRGVERSRRHRGGDELNLVVREDDWVVVATAREGDGSCEQQRGGREWAHSAPPSICCGHQSQKQQHKKNLNYSHTAISDY